MRHICGALGANDQTHLVAAIADGLALAPPFTPRMPRTGKPFSVLMSNFGPLGWVSDAEGGYRYQPGHPVTGNPWPAIPGLLMDLWRNHANCPAPPEACLINLYGRGTKMGLHQDRDEDDFSAPVLSVSLGDDARFRWGGTSWRGPTRSIVLKSGDIVLLEGETRLAYHGIDRIYPGTSDLLAGFGQFLPDGGRINLTLRRVTSH